MYTVGLGEIRPLSASMRGDNMFAVRVAGDLDRGLGVGLSCNELDDANRLTRSLAKGEPSTGALRGLGMPFFR